MKNKGQFKKGHIPQAPFKKGQVSIFKGRHHSLESKKKLSKSALEGFRTGKRKINVFVKGHTIWIGKKHSLETREKMSLSSKGKHKPWMLGERNHKWKGGITPINKAIRESLEYEEWRKAVFERDNYTCQNCGQVGGYLEADHIKPFALFLELRFDINNGRTLCRPCHKELGWELSREGLREKDTGRFIGKGGLIYVN